MEMFLYIAALLIANTIQGITGFAGNVLAMPPVAVVLGVDTARTALNVLGVVSGLFMTIWFRQHIIWREVGRIIAYIMPGIIAGIAIYRIFPADNLLAAYGLVVALIGAWYLRGKRKRILPRPAMAAVIFAAGVMQGMFVSGGPLLVIYAVTILRNKEAFRATLSAVWCILNLFILADIMWEGTLTPDVIHYSLIGVVPVRAATIIGGELQKRVSQSAFMKLTYLLLIASGASLIVRALA